MGARAVGRTREVGADAIPILGAGATQRPPCHRLPPRRNGDGDQRPEDAVNASLKIQPRHLERDAYLYVRQSSMRQVIENVESTRRQYALRGRATALGWRDEQIVVVDDDQGESGASASWRVGFQRLVSDVGLGRAGIVMGLEVSRLARNNADWHRLLEICALADTLILDEDGVYDPASFNDRLLLGLKGTMSEAELHVIKARLRGGILNKVRRGEYRCPLPTGFVYDEVGEVAFDPDSQVRETIAYFFETFSRVGSASQTVKVFRKEGLRFPSRIRNRAPTIFQPLTISTAIRTLNNPRYAGAYVYGRRQYRRAVDGKKKLRTRERDDWLACIPNAHPGYIAWEQFQQNLNTLKVNGQGYEVARASPPREGTSLLQGRAVCGRCGRHLRVRYAARRGRLEDWYVCDRAHGSRGEPSCQSIAGAPIDKAIGKLIADQMTPAAVELALEIRREIEARHDEADRLRRRAVERAQIEAGLAQRRFMLVDPANRLVADTLEREWNDKLRALASAQEERERARQEDQLAVEGTTGIHVRFKGGRTETLTTENPKSSAQQVKTLQTVIELVDRLLDDHVYFEIADILNQKAVRPGGSARRDQADARFTDLRVAYLAHQYGLRSRYDRLRDRGMLTNAEITAKLGICESTVKRWVRYGLITRHAYSGQAYLYEPPGSDLPPKHFSRWDRLVDRAAALRRTPDSRCTLPAEGGAI